MQSEKANDADAQSLHEEVAHLEGSNSSEGEMDVATPDPPEEPGHRLSLEETRPIKLEGTGTPPEAQESSAVQMAELQVMSRRHCAYERSRPTMPREMHFHLVLT